MPSADLEAAFTDAQLWGLELDTRYRVLAVTLEPAAVSLPWEVAGDDRRVQVLAHPVSTVLASLRSVDDGRRLLHTFSEEQLVDVAAAFGGAPLRGPVFGRPEPRPGDWGPQFSLEGRSTAGDGTRATLTVSITADGRELDLFARFDTLEVRAPDGSALLVEGPRPTG